MNTSIIPKVPLCLFVISPTSISPCSYTSTQGYHWPVFLSQSIHFYFLEFYRNEIIFDVLIFEWFSTQHNYCEIHSLFFIYQYFFLSVVEQCSAEHWSCSSFKLLQVELLWAVVYRSSCRYMLSFIFGECIGVDWLGCMVVVCLTFKETTKLFSRVAERFYIPFSNVWEFLHIFTNTWGNQFFNLRHSNSVW